MLPPYPADGMLAWPVSRRMNAPKNNKPKLIEHEPGAVYRNVQIGAVYC
jgi:putative SOS response-associated peptidase YedK